MACLLPACRDYILQLRFKPKPLLQAGCFRPSAAQPRSAMLPQPLMQHRDGGLVRLDELLGHGFAVIGFDSPAFRAGAQRLLPPGMPGRVLALVRRDDDFVGGEANAIPRARDVSGELGAVLERCGAVAIVVRPDRYGWHLVNEKELGDATPANTPVEIASRTFVPLIPEH